MLQARRIEPAGQRQSCRTEYIGTASYRRPKISKPFRFIRWLSFAATVLLISPAWAQSSAQAPRAACSALADDAQRLACFDRTARQQAVPALPAPGSANPANSPSALVNPATPPKPASSGPDAPVQTPTRTGFRSCSNARQSELSRFWELEPGSDCGTFGIRGYRPISLSWIGSDSVNTTPTSPAAGHTGSFAPYSTSEARIQLSVRTKIARGLLTDDDTPGRDSLWFGYTQQSYWQIFNSALSRPFRSTDHEPELTYIYPTDAQFPGGWRLRYSGISAVHQSNGQSLPLSRSWNRAVLMAGMEQGDRFRVQVRAWARLPENAAQDDNPDIADYIGRAELAGFWNVGKDDTVGLTLRHSLRREARGSARLEWLKALGGATIGNEANNLRFHMQLFSGYGDSLIDYNRRRTVLSIGLSLVDF
jgi:phospholipase A1